MAPFYANINIQTLIGLFLLVLCLVIALFGYLLRRFRFLDGQNFYFSENLGRILLMASAIFAVAAGLMLLYVRVTL
jgi:hypothetical protein